MPQDVPMVHVLSAAVPASSGAGNLELVVVAGVFAFGGALISVLGTIGIEWKKGRQADRRASLDDANTARQARREALRIACADFAAALMRFQAGHLSSDSGPNWKSSMKKLAESWAFQNPRQCSSQPTRPRLYTRVRLATLPCPGRVRR